MTKYVLIDAELDEITTIEALTPALAAEAVDVANGDKDGGRYTEQAADHRAEGPGYEVYEGSAFEFPHLAADVRVALRPITFIEKSIDLPAITNVVPMTARRVRLPRRLLHTAAAAAAVLVAMIGYNLTITATAKAKAPIEVFGATLLTPVVHVGGKIRELYT